MEETKSSDETKETNTEIEKSEEETLEEEAEKQPVEEIEEAKPRLKKEKEEIVEERFYTIPLAKAWLMPPNKRAAKAVRILKDFIIRHMKLENRGGAEEEETEPKRLIISNEVNEKIWSRGIEKPPRKIRVRAAKDKDGNVTVYLAEGD